MQDDANGTGRSACVVKLHLLRAALYLFGRRFEMIILSRIHCIGTEFEIKTADVLTDTRIGRICFF